MIPKQIIIHNTASSRDKTTLDNVNEWHQLRWPDFKSSLGFWVGYHYLITEDGAVVQTRRDNESGAHCIPNDGRIGICLTGNFDIEQPTSDQFNSLQNLLDKLTKEYGIALDNVLAHSQINNTACPGKHLYEWVLVYKQYSFLKLAIERLKNKILALIKGRA